MQDKYLKHLLLLLLFSCAVILNSFSKTQKSLSDSTKTQKNEKPGIFVIKNVNIIPMTLENKIIKNATVVIKDNKILSINKPVTGNAEIIDGKGKWLIPGLIDMHVHNMADVNLGATFPTKGANAFTNTQDFMLLYVANGVTTVFELSARPEHFGERNEIIKGNVIGPRVALAFLIDGGEGSGNIANTPADGRQSVRIAKAQGYEFIKVYSHLNIETFKAIVDEAGRQRMKVVGHIPNAFKGRIEEAFVPNYDMVAHAEEYAKQTDTFSDHDAKRFAQLAKKNGTWLSPTLTAIVRIGEQARSLDGIRNLSSLKYVPPLLQSKWLTANNYNKGTTPEFVAHIDKIADFNIRLVKAFKEARVPMVAGTDSGTSGVVWGFALHDEIELLVKAGLTPGEALISATRLPATWLGIDNKIGTVETGKYADLVLLDANPLTDISNTRKISGVFVNGRWLDKSGINAMLSDLAKRNAASKNKFDWSKRGEL
ncbi:amidohydrolase family protein [Mucilaginibacter sp. BJC16-A38]|uniref:amidohydrolase family protein n=1 Tax=Mucilaginibacter phenanthrenivorans TaxID=1234842 RepID=UPI00215766CD|nr:amidohydrolase family protein [Mucilaginibacter phenanthrenivorans]MCR8556389.1 amidohydrolase family protein [Mucilaginibacter phenanthrenivorans]